jgi:hypothetical protein
MGAKSPQRAFLDRVQNVFAFLVEEFGFELEGPDDLEHRGFPRNVAHVQYIKAPAIILHFDCEGVYQNVLLQGYRKESGCRREGWAACGLHQAMRIRCPKLQFPQSTTEPGLTDDLRFCAKVLREHFADFLVGDPSIVFETLLKKR